MFGKILLAWDGSENAAVVYEVASDLGERYLAELVAVSAAHAPEHAELAGEKERALDEGRAFYARNLEPLPREAEGSGARLRHEVVSGDDPVEALLRLPRDEVFDLTVIGRRGLVRKSWFRVRNVHDRVVRYAPCPVVDVGHEK
jgi:nucleotide-binding universal stress UspA family protein